MKLKGAAYFAFCVIFLSQMGIAYSQETKTIQGEVIDPALYLREGKHGKEFENQIYDSVDSGQTLGILEDVSGNVYLFLASEPGIDPNDMAYDYAGRKVKVTGTVFEKSGVRGVVPTSVEPLEPIPQETGTESVYDEEEN
jgi:hypothetical protein